MSDFLTVMKARRSRYGLEKKSCVPADRITGLVREAVLHTPSAFNMQSSRAAVLYGEEHSRLWKLTLEALRAQVPAADFPVVEEKIDSFSAGCGTVLYFDDTAVTDSLARQYPLYRENFPVWAEQSNGILQFSVWCLLEEAGLGASLQHYNPLIDGEVRKAWGLPAAWRLIAQMPFGVPAAQPGPKDFRPVEELVRVFGEDRLTSTDI